MDIWHIFENLIKMGFESFEVLRGAFQEIQDGLRSDPDPENLGEIPPRHIMSEFDRIGIDAYEKQASKEIFIKRKGVLEPVTNIGIAFAFGGGQKTEYKFTDGLEFLNDPQKHLKASYRRPKPLVLTDRDVRIIRQVLQARSSWRIKKWVDLGARKWAIQRMLTTFKNICPYWPVICSQYATHLLQPETWYHLNFAQACKTVGGLLQLTTNALLDKKVEINRPLSSWLNDSVTLYLKILIPQDALQEAMRSSWKQIADLKKLLNVKNHENQSYTEQIHEAEAFKKRLHERWRREKQEKPTRLIEIPENAHYKHRPVDSVIRVDHGNPYGQIAALPETPSMLSALPSNRSSQRHDLLIGWKKSNTWRKFVVKDFFVPETETPPLHLVDPKGNHLLTFNGTNGYGPPQGIDPKAFQQAQIEKKNGIITRYPQNKPIHPKKASSTTRQPDYSQIYGSVIKEFKRGY